MSEDIFEMFMHKNHGDFQKLSVTVKLLSIMQQCDSEVGKITFPNIQTLTSKIWTNNL